MEQDTPPMQWSDNDIPGLLIDRGWRQGTIFWAPQVQSSRIGNDGEGFVTLTHDVPGDGRFVVVSQSCDINAPIDKEPVVEAFACIVEPNATTRANYKRSYRRFEIDFDEGLMAHAAIRVAFDKRALLELEPHNWPGSEDRLRAFYRWLGGRASRKALPAPIVVALVDPLHDVMKNLRRRNPHQFVAFNAAVAEIHIGLPESELPPFDIPLTLLLDGDELSSEAADALEFVEVELRARLDPDRANLIGIFPATKSRMSVETYFASARVELDYFTYDGDEILGLEPLA